LIETKIENGKVEPVHKLKYELVTTHTARRSFATNAYRAGIPAGKIMQITGHKTEQDFFRYIKVSSIDNAMELQGHAFFN
jgi:integrase